MKVSFSHEQEHIAVAYMAFPVINPDWTFTDAAGHVHDKSLRTLEWVVTASWFCEDCRDTHDDGEYRCKRCGEKVEPGVKVEPGGVWHKPGMTEVRLTVEDHPRWERATWSLHPDEARSLEAHLHVGQERGDIAAVLNEWACSFVRQTERLPDSASAGV